VGGDWFGPLVPSGFPHVAYGRTVCYYVPYSYTFGCIGCRWGEISLCVNWVDIVDGVSVS